VQSRRQLLLQSKKAKSHRLQRRRLPLSLMSARPRLHLLRPGVVPPLLQHPSRKPLHLQSRSPKSQLRSRTAVKSRRPLQSSRDQQLRARRHRRQFSSRRQRTALNRSSRAASQDQTVRVRARSFPAHRVLVQSRQALRSHRRVRLHRPRQAQALASQAHVAMSDRVRAEALMIALAAERRASADR